MIMPDAEAAARRALWDAPQDAADDAEDDDGDDGAAAVEAGEAGGVEGFSEAALPEEGAAAAAAAGGAPVGARLPAGARAARPAPRDARAAAPSFTRPAPGRPLPLSQAELAGGGGTRPLAQQGAPAAAADALPGGMASLLQQMAPALSSMATSGANGAPGIGGGRVNDGVLPAGGADGALSGLFSAAQARAAGGAGAPGGGDMGSAITNMLMSATRDAGAANGGGADGYRGLRQRRRRRRRRRGCRRRRRDAGVAAPAHFKDERPGAGGDRRASGGGGRRRRRGGQARGAVAQPRVPAAGLELAAADADAADDDGRLRPRRPRRGLRAAPRQLHVPAAAAAAAAATAAAAALPVPAAVPALVRLAEGHGS